ncbi:mogroside IE synthase [Ricinus communis]|uniref:Glycosyltransferase n=1 Tax=Ricinus communis TaxID=3988 RepID=B9T2H3_RICCO|nr:mogroside IE synthase [Ricinus communis]EEF29928.1 UDP-glucosyltransferase, putative [Ricinus communis]|eukprot:XP_002532442.1 UDP-glycosyltransferase 74G1 [Ricinus communis]
MEKAANASKAHAVILPYPSQGHINPMLQFAKRLVSKGVKATLANTKAINKSMHSDPSCLIDIETISDGFDEGGSAQAKSTEVYLSTLKVVGAKSLANVIKRFKDSDCPVTAIIYDGFLPWALDVAKQFGILAVAFLTQACAVNNAYYHVQRGLLRVPGSSPTVSLPGLPLLQVSELPSFISDYVSYPGFRNLLVDQFRNIDGADWVLCNTFYRLEEEVVDWMAKKWRLRTVGPTLPSKYLDKRLEYDKDYGINLFKPDSGTCLNWLKTKPSRSVVYVSFGSVAELGTEQMEELALGLKGSNCYFLWVVRTSGWSKLPENFIEETYGKGLAVSWCPQLEVLANEAIGCFVTHCGFNSVLEALSLGVPIVAMPQWADQPTNAKYVEDVWKVGIRARPNEKGIVRRETVELCIREVMEGQKGKEIKENANKWKNLAKEAIDESGTSDKNIDELVAKISSS